MRAVHESSAVRAAEDLLLSRMVDDDLMVRAATALARSCAEILAESRRLVYGADVVLLVGSGNNGGDALHAGAQLARRGSFVTAVLLSDAVHERGLQQLLRAGGRVLSETDGRSDSVVRAADLVVDGIVGIGGHGGLRPRAAQLARIATESAAVVVAVDLPSGVAADTGGVQGEAIWADVTVTFGVLKPGLLLPPGAEHSGMVETADIGLTETLEQPSIEVLDAMDVARLQPHPVPSDHKYSQGVVAVAAGSAKFPGAAVLTVGSASVTKPGLVRYCGEATNEVVSAWPSAIVTDGGPDAVGRAQAWAVGPGLGLDERAQRTLGQVLAQDLPTVVDADGLTLLAQDPQLLLHRSAPVVLTPHEGEFARLAPDLDFRADRINAVRRLADRLSATVLLKGSTTVVASPSGQVRLNPTGTPFLATAGTGDVLTGMVGAYLAAAIDPLDAASLGAFLHGLAGRLASAGAPCTSRDVVDAIPEAISVATTP